MWLSKPSSAHQAEVQRWQLRTAGGLLSLRPASDCAALARAEAERPWQPAHALAACQCPASFLTTGPMADFNDSSSTTHNRAGCGTQAEIYVGAQTGASERHALVGSGQSQLEVNTMRQSTGGHVAVARMCRKARATTWGCAGEQRCGCRLLNVADCSHVRTERGCWRAGALAAGQRLGCQLGVSSGSRGLSWPAPPLRSQRGPWRAVALAAERRLGCQLGGTRRRGHDPSRPRCT